MEVQTWPIERVVIRDRARKNLRDLTALKESWIAVGQLQPIAARPDGTLVFGHRRLAAARELGETVIAVRLWTAESAYEILRAEQDENTCREALLPVEAAELRKQLAESIKPEAEKAHREGSARGGRGEGFVNLTKPSVDTRKLASESTGYSATTLGKVDDIVNAAVDAAEDSEVREEAQRQIEELAKPGTPVDPAHKAVKQARAKAAREAKLKAGLGPGQWTEAPAAKPELTLTRRLTDGINRGQNLETLAAEITDQNLDLDVKTLYALRNRIRDEIKVREAMKDALNQQIKRLGYDTRKVTVK